MDRQSKELEFFQEENQRLKERVKWSEQSSEEELRQLRDENKRLREEYQEEKEGFSRRREEFSVLGEQL